MQPRPTWSELSLFEARHLRLGQLDAHASRSGGRRVAAVRARGQIELGQLLTSTAYPLESRPCGKCRQRKEDNSNDHHDRLYGDSVHVSGLRCHFEFLSCGEMQYEQGFFRSGSIGRSRVIETLIVSFSRRQARSSRQIQRASASSRTTISMPEATRAKRS